MGFFPPGTPSPYSQTDTNPAAGANLAMTLPANQRIQIVGIQYILQTDATATIRIPNIRLTMGNRIMQFWDPTGVPAGQTFVISWWSGLGATVNVSSLQRYLPLPANIIMNAQAPISTTIFNLQPGDQISSPILWGLEWIEPD